MKREDIKFYYDPDGFDCLSTSYPCDTQFMVYNPLLHRYFLTAEALDHYGIDADRNQVGSNPNKVGDLIKKTSKKVYDYINYKAGFSRYQIMLYRIATAPKTIYPDQYFMRKQFEEALVDQARFIVENGDSARVGRYNAESEIPPTAPRPEDNMRDFSDMSPECERTLDSLNLTRWFSTGRCVLPDLNKY